MTTGQIHFPSIRRYQSGFSSSIENPRQGSQPIYLRIGAETPLRENVRAELRVFVKEILLKYGTRLTSRQGDRNRARAGSAALQTPCSPCADRNQWRG